VVVVVRIGGRGDSVFDCLVAGGRGGDFFWRLPLLLGSLFVVTSSCLYFWGF